MMKKIISNQNELELLYSIQTLLESSNLLFVTPQNEKIPIPSDLFQVITETLFHLLRGRKLLLVPETDYISTHTAGEILSLSPRSVINLIREGSLQACLSGNRYSVQLQSVLHYKIMHQS